jgi:hypothetical protein
VFRIYGCAAATVAMVCLVAGSASAHRVRLDDGLYTTYSGPDDGSQVYMLVCGQLEQTSGCYGSPWLSGFESACALVEGRPSTHDNVVKRTIYVLDRRTTKGDPLQLFVYDRTDTITATYDTVNVTLAQQISLAIPGAPTAKCALAANDRFVYAGSDKDKTAVSIAKDTLAVTKIGGFSPPEHVRTITADTRGYVVVAFDDGNVEFDPNGNEIGGGGGREVIGNTRNSVRPNE